MLSEPNLSLRMTEITAAIIRPLLANLPERVKQFSRRYHEVRTNAYNSGGYPGVRDEDTQQTQEKTTQRKPQSSDSSASSRAS